MYALAVFSVALLAGQVSGYALRSRSPFNALLKRQTDNGDDVPAQCQSVCAAFENAANDPTCVDPSCLCATAVAQSFVGCLDCALSLDPDPSLEAEAQQDLSSFSSSCSQAGFNVGQLSLSVSDVAASATGGAGASVFFSSTPAISLSFSTISKTDTDAPVSTTGASGPSSSSSSGSGSSSPLTAQKGNGATGRGAVSGLLLAGAAILAFAL
ncbi:hypothetical protein OBBRIDRAFT_793374 [Obba rivulosa]|uniref:Extracellular membrane protein CFEM domain-containing protein n=1 Tax=Obba rivulosa TaxID=1052685 RepID=A0A8E2DJG5_9APHY|nr:hypothetical protein OBBRIDRAFT_793374 [Obba rivulosa]